jgi:hypothetical protein
MGMLFRIVFSSLVIVSFTIIVSLSFFSEPKYFSFPEIPQNFKQEISKLEIEESIIYKQQYNAFDTLYTSADTVSFDGK